MVPLMYALLENHDSASSLGLEFIPPYFDKNASFKHGINFAFSGAPALPTGFLNSMGIFTTTNVSLSDEVSWYLQVKAKIALSPYKIIPGKGRKLDYKILYLFCQCIIS